MDWLHDHLIRTTDFNNKYCSNVPVTVTAIHKNTEYSVYSRVSHLPAVTLRVAQPWCIHLVLGKDGKVHRPRHSTWQFQNAFDLSVRIHIAFASSIYCTLHSTRAALWSSTAWQRCDSLCLGESECTDPKRFTEPNVQMIRLFIFAETQH